MSAPGYLRLRKPLHPPLPVPVWPAGVIAAPFDRNDAVALHRLLELGYRNGFGHVPAFDTWWPLLTGDEEFDERLCFVAKADGVPVGFCQCWTSGFIKDIAVHPDWRGQGIGAALLRTAFGAFAARGLPHVDLKVDPSNITAIALYRRVGMIEVVG